ncbi:unannotated protein [freshwater metagenome]|uniref:Unannotated protein n=1 Tax=freshwater metagenome TaxID=449393 RepID=A0A6J7J509_9ZZZZ
MNYGAGAGGVGAAGLGLSQASALGTGLLGWIVIGVTMALCAGIIGLRVSAKKNG